MKKRIYAMLLAAVMVFGVSACGTSDTEKEEALRAIMRQYHPGENAYFNPAAIPRTLAYKLTVEKMTVKRKELKK